MINIKRFIFNPFQLNTYVLSDETNDCVIIDPGCYEAHEKEELVSFIDSNKLQPKLLLNTHGHIDHIVGNTFVADQFSIPLVSHEDTVHFLKNAVAYGESFGFEIDRVLLPSEFLDDGNMVLFGKSELKALHTPGHADGSICFYSAQDGFIIAGDVLFKESIGRTDLPTGNYDLLQKSIWEKLFTLPENTIVYPGHGPETNIGTEKVSNPFVAIGN